MPTVISVIQKALAVDSVWSVVLRGGIWLVIAIIIMISTDKPDPGKSMKDLKASLGFFLMFMIISGGLIYLLFGFAPV
ncbi:MAG: hypothetical protein GF381_01710 [Candidatus Pacebacteria bacterium]|nr:hypothetical protein [Candidatus Paceibacterota bacterium]